MAEFKFAEFSEDDRERRTKLRAHAGDLLMQREVEWMSPRKQKEVERELGHLTFELWATTREIAMEDGKPVERYGTEPTPLMVPILGQQQAV